VLRLLAISGSLRKKSFNTQLLTALSEVDSEQIALKMYMLDQMKFHSTMQIWRNSQAFLER